MCSEFIPVFDVQEELLVRYGIDVDHIRNKGNMNLCFLPLIPGCYWAAVEDSGGRHCLQALVAGNDPLEVEWS